MMPAQTSARDIVGCWRAPETEGVELGYCFYPNGVLVLRDPRHKRIAMRGAWRLEEGGRLVISDVIDPSEIRPEPERELIRSERHQISITEITSDSMVWQPEEARQRVSLRRAGSLPEQEQKAFWKRLFGR
jgi:hypothetical protein